MNSFIRFKYNIIYQVTMKNKLVCTAMFIIFATTLGLTSSVYAQGNSSDAANETGGGNESNSSSEGNKTTSTGMGAAIPTPSTSNTGGNSGNAGTG